MLKSACVDFAVSVVAVI